MDSSHSHSNSQSKNISMSLNISQKQNQSLKQMQRMMISPQMQQALTVMQAPILELASLIEAEMEENPVLEYLEEKGSEELKEIASELEQQQEPNPEKELSFDDRDLEILKRLDEDFRDHFSQNESYTLKRTQEEDERKTFVEQSIVEQISIFEYLMGQAKETLQSAEEIAIAEIIIGNLDENGLLTTPIEEILELHPYTSDQISTVLTQIQDLDPPGIGATSLQELFKIQLKRKGEEGSIAYQIVAKHWEDLLHNRIPSISKGLHISKDLVAEAITKKIAPLDLHPASSYSDQIVQHIIPDATVNDDLQVVVNQEFIPNLRFNRKYIRMLDDENLKSDVKDYIHNKINSAKWLLKNIDQRHSTLERIVSAIVDVQKDFFQNPQGKLVPLMMKTIADEIEVHESTVARSVANKYVDTPRGILPLKSFFSNAYTTAEGDDISSRTVRDVLKDIIDGENKMRPLSDESLSKLLEKKGIQCARRTVAKYRSELNIGNTQQRRMY